MIEGFGGTSSQDNNFLGYFYPYRVTFRLFLHKMHPVYRQLTNDERISTR